jgi:peptide/nickel transport system substrate-binding protein
MKALGRRPRVLVAVIGLIATSMVAAACGSASTSGGSGSSSVLTMEASPENSLTQSFNPFSPTSAGYQLGATAMINEPLLQFDVADPTVHPYPWLATSYAWGNGGKSITFQVRRGVKWSNGTTMTAADVAFTYSLVKDHPDINVGGLKIGRVTATGNSVTLNFGSPQYRSLQLIASVPIVPKATWSNVSNPGTFVDANPVGTGPYVLKTFTSQGITLQRNPNYWSNPWGKPRVAELRFPAYATNTNDYEALIDGQAQWEGNYLTGLPSWVKKDPAHNHYWNDPVATNALLPNLAKWPTNQQPVREAISLAIDRATIGKEGESGLESPISDAAGLPLPSFKAFLTPAASARKLSPTPQIQAAETVLEKAGYVKGSDGFFRSKSGRELSIEMVDPTDYTDYAADDAIIAQDLQKAGIKATFTGLSVGAWSSDLADGDFQLTMYYSAVGINPYAIYDGWLDSTLTAPIGKAATGDFERLHSSVVDAALKKVTAARSQADVLSALSPIENYFANQFPIIPVVGAAQWNEYNTSQFTGWPTPSNPYEVGGPAPPTNEVIVLRLKPVK